MRKPALMMLCDDKSRRLRCHPNRLGAVIAKDIEPVLERLYAGPDVSQIVVAVVASTVPEIRLHDVCQTGKNVASMPRG